jgi:hypothetical protein
MNIITYLIVNSSILIEENICILMFFPLSFSNVKVIWTDRRDRTISVNENVIMNPRKFVISHPYPNEWNLRIVRVRSTDHGEYRCQVNSDPVQTKFVVVIVQGW